MIEISEKFFQCPYCWQSISMIFEPSNEYMQEYIEDCEVCCNPIKVKYKTSFNSFEYFEALNLDE